MKKRQYSHHVSDDTGKDRAKIQSDIDDYLNAGGKIEQLSDEKTSFDMMKRIKPRLWAKDGMRNPNRLSPEDDHQH